MTQEIKPAYVTFEQAKLLKSKGFKLETNCYYFEDHEFCQYKIVDTYGYYGDEYTVELDELYKNWNDAFLQKKNGDRCFGCSKDKVYFETYSAPEQWQVVEWLRITHDIHITYGCDYNWKLKECRGKAKFYYIINFDLLDSLDKNLEPKFLFDTPQEAYSTAFDYILQNNLI